MSLDGIPDWLDPARIVREAEKASGGEAEVYIIISREVDVHAKHDGVEKAATRLEVSVGVRVSVDGRVGGARGQVSGTGDLEEIIREAVSIARGTPRDEYWKGFNPRVATSPGAPRHLYDPETAEAGPAELASLLGKVAKAVEEEGAVLGGAVARVSARVRMYANSHGGPLEERSTSFGLWLEAVKGEGTYFEVIDSTRIEAERAIEKAARAARRALEADGARGLEEAVRGQLLMEPLVAGDVLTVLMAPALSAEAVIEGRSPLAGKLGSAVISKSLTVRDDPFVEFRPEARRFDDEGHPASPRALVEDGVLKAYLHAYYTFNRFGEGGGPGNAVRRSPWARPQPGQSTLVLEPSQAKPGIEDLAHLMDRGVIVTGVIGLWMSRPESGRLTATITHGYLVERGSVVRPIKGASLLANLYYIPGEGFIAAAGEPECSGGACSPALLVDGATIS